MAACKMHLAITFIKRAGVWMEGMSDLKALWKAGQSTPTASSKRYLSQASHTRCLTSYHGPAREWYEAQEEDKRMKAQSE